MTSFIILKLEFNDFFLIFIHVTQLSFPPLGVGCAYDFQ